MWNVCRDEPDTYSLSSSQLPGECGCPGVPACCGSTRLRLSSGPRNRDVWYMKEIFYISGCFQELTWYNQELPIATFRLKLKKVGKISRPFRYNLNQIPYDYPVEVRNRFKGLDLTECLMNFGQRFIILCRRWWLKPSPRKRIAKRQNDCLRRPYK